MVLSLLASHCTQRSRILTSNGYGSYFGFVDLRVRNEIDIYSEFCGEYQAQIYSQFIHFTSCIHLVKSASFSFEPVPLSQSSYFKINTYEGNTFLFQNQKEIITSGKVDVYKITHFKRLLKQILGNSQVQ